MLKTGFTRVQRRGQMASDMNDRREGESGAVFEIGRSGALVLDAIRRNGSVARSELTEHTPLSQQSVHRLTDMLLERGLLRLDAPKISGRGKPSPQLALAPAGAYGIGVAIDTDDVRIAVNQPVGLYSGAFLAWV